MERHKFTSIKLNKLNDEQKVLYTTIWRLLWVHVQLYSLVEDCVASLLRDFVYCDYPLSFHRGLGSVPKCSVLDCLHLSMMLWLLSFHSSGRTSYLDPNSRLGWAVWDVWRRLLERQSVHHARFLWVYEWCREFTIMGSPKSAQTKFHWSLSALKTTFSRK